MEEARLVLEEEDTIQDPLVSHLGEEEVVVLLVVEVEEVVVVEEPLRPLYSSILSALFY